MVASQRWLSRDWAQDPMAMRISWPLPRTAAIRVRGEIDLCTAPGLEQELRRLIRGPVDAVVVDLSQVGFLAVAGIDCLLRAKGIADKLGVRLYIDRGDSRVVNRVFTLLRDTLPPGFSTPVSRN